MRILLSLPAYLAALVLVAAVSFVTVLFFVGPHADLSRYKQVTAGLARLEL